MKTRPWPIVILAFLQLLAPVASILINASLAHMGLTEYLAALFKDTAPLKLVEFFALPIVASVSVYLVKEWSYGIFLATVSYVSYANFVTWRHYPQIFPLSIVVASYLVNIGLVSYFLLPAVRAVYLNRKLRWWESPPRYVVQVPATAEAEDGRAVPCTITDLSEGGAFLMSDRALGDKKALRLTFSVLERELSITAAVVYRNRRKVGGYGIRFVHTKETREAIARWVKGFATMGLPTTRGPEIPWHLGLSSWFKTAFTTGKGLVPEVPARADAEPVISLDERRKREDRAA